MMSTQSNPPTCPQCGAAIPPDAPAGLCPKCVLARAATEPDLGQNTPDRPQAPALESVRAAFPQLEILELIGVGGMGAVFKARQPHLDRFVALKLLPESLAANPASAERFRREARVLAKLNHPNIVSVFDFGQSGGFCFLLMEYVDGANLRQAMRAGRFTPPQALAIVPRICEALQFAHERGVLHRDIKPENILIDQDGRVKIADFGIAKLLEKDAHSVTLTASGAALGTPAYMAPEQIETPSEVDHRADIYSLGVVFYEMLTGELPLGRFAPPSQKTPLDERVDQIVLRALAKERELRQQSAGEVKTQVEQVPGEGLPPRTVLVPSLAAAARGSSTPATPNPEARLSRLALWGAALVGLSLPVPLLLVFALFLGMVGGLSWLEVWAALVSITVFGLSGTLLGWLALSQIRTGWGQLRGLPLALFAALTWPVLVALAVAFLPPLMIVTPESPSLLTRIFAIVLPLGCLAGVVWLVRATVRWATAPPLAPAPDRPARP